MATTASADRSEQPTTAPVVVVSADTHIGPRLREDLRPYCPRQHLETFDAYIGRLDEVRASQLVPETLFDQFLSKTGFANLQTAGHYDMPTRLADMNRDGVAAEVIFHASENGQPIPFRPFSGFFGYAVGEDAALAAVGNRIYNHWLADVCSLEPHRHAGLAHLPMWDVDSAVKEVEWAREAGLRGVNFPAMRGDLPEYNHPGWEPLWAACEALEMPLTTHIGGGSPAHFAGHEGLPLKMYEDGAVFGRRAIHWMIFGGVFERHPGLKLVITEIAGEWWLAYLAELDSVWQASRAHLGDRVPRSPSEYAATNVYYGASFMAHFEAEAAVRDGYADRLMWGSDYPHLEGTYQYGVEVDGETATHLAMRNTFAGIPADEVRRMAGRTAIEVYGLDPPALAAMVEAIDAPTPASLSSRPQSIPAGLSALAFRETGAWR